MLARVRLVPGQRLCCPFRERLQGFQLFADMTEVVVQFAPDEQFVEKFLSALAALPLTEVVSVRTEDDGKSVLGTRFCAVRMKERMILADYAAEATPASN